MKHITAQSPQIKWFSSYSLTWSCSFLAVTCEQMLVSFSLFVDLMNLFPQSCSG